MLNVPKCLHFDVLSESTDNFSFTWQPVSAATGYELEISFAESFEDALRGLCWDSWDCEQNAWQENPGTMLTWDEWEALRSKGRTWASLESAWLTWDEFESKNLTWSDFENLPISFLIYKGNGTGMRPGPDDSSAGCSWSALDARFLTWQQLESKQNTWTQIENLPPDDEMHVWISKPFMTCYGRWAWLRLRAYNQLGEYSAWLETGRQPVRQYRDKMAYEYVNKTGPLQVNADGIGQITGKDYVVTYDSNAMRAVRREWDELRDLKAQPQVTSLVNGKLRFKSEKTIPPGQSWSGLLAAFPYYFEGATSGSLVQMDILKDGTIKN